MPFRNFISASILASLFIITLAGCGGEDDPAPSRIHKALYGLWGNSSTVYLAGAQDDGTVVPKIYALQGSTWSDMPFDLGSFDQSCEANSACSGGRGVDVRNILGTDDGDLFALGSWHQIFKLVDGEWTQDWSGLETAPFDTDPTGSFFLGLTIEETCYGLSRTGVVVHDGLGWRVFSTPDTSSLSGLWGDSSDSIYLASSTDLFHFDGTQWSTVDLGYDGVLGAITGVSDTELYIATSDGAVLAWDGSSYETVLAPKGADWTCLVTHLDDGDIVALRVGGASGSEGELNVKSRGWAAVWSGDDVRWRDVWGRSAADIYLVGHTPSSASTQEARISHFDGSEWTRVTIDPEKQAAHSMRRGITRP